MVKPRASETIEGIQGEFDVEIYDQMMRRMRDKGWLETKLILNMGIGQGSALEIGPGPGYLGLEWLKKTEGTTLIGLEISPNMITIAERNAREYRLEDRVKYVTCDAQDMPFDENTFDGVFTNGSLHEWSQPKKIFDEVYRVLKKGGMLRISVPDLAFAISLYSSSERERMLDNYFFVDHRGSYFARHKYMYDFESLKAILEKTGFKNVVRCSYRQGKMPDLHLLDSRPEDSLFVEAIKL